MLVVCVGAAVPGFVVWETQQRNGTSDMLFLSDLFILPWCRTGSELNIHLSLLMWAHDISLPCRYAACMEELGKWTVNLILVQPSVGSFGNPYTSRAFLLGDTSNYVSSAELFSSVFYKTWSPVSKMKDIEPLILSSLLQNYVFPPLQSLCVIPAVLFPSEVFS